MPGSHTVSNIYTYFVSRTTRQNKLAEHNEHKSITIYEITFKHARFSHVPTALPSLISTSIPRPQSPSKAVAPGSLQMYTTSWLSVKPLKRVAEHFV